jgi:ATP-dependent helicase/nuclease subunit A
VAGQVAALRLRDLVTREQAESVDLRALERFLASPLAEEIRRGRNVLREYRFTLLMDDRMYDPQASGEDAILLQGVVDCCFETDAGITVVDFKTDYVRTAEEIAQRAGRYRVQLETYSNALERVLEKRVVRRVLYFLTPGETAEV